MSNTLHFFYGTMAAGKSSSLIQEHYNFTQKNVDAWVIKPIVDRTSEPKVTSRIGLECPATIMKEIRWEDIIKMKEFYSKVYMVDEVQFFKPKDIDNLVKLADTYGKLIFCYGLMVDVNEKLFPIFYKNPSEKITFIEKISKSLLNRYNENIPLHERLSLIYHSYTIPFDEFAFVDIINSTHRTNTIKEKMLLSDRLFPMETTN